MFSAADRTVRLRDSFCCQPAPLNRYRPSRQQLSPAGTCDQFPVCYSQGRAKSWKTDPLSFGYWLNERDRQAQREHSVTCCETPVVLVILMQCGRVTGKTRVCSALSQSVCLVEARDLRRLRLVCFDSNSSGTMSCAQFPFSRSFVEHP